MPGLDARTLLICVIGSGAIATAAGGCGTTERSGGVGDTLTAKGLEATVEQVDTNVPVPESDVTGLSQPAPGAKLVGTRVRVCSDHGGAIGAYAFGLDASSGDATLKYPERNYDDPFETVREGCGDGWVVFEIPEPAQPERVTFGFEDTGSFREPQTEVDAKFSWSIAD
jgi:hypothetical protein